MVESLKATYQFILNLFSMIIGLAVGAIVLVLGVIIGLILVVILVCLELSDHLERRKRKPITYR